MKWRSPQQVPEYALALVYTSLGEKERAIEALEHGFAGGNKSYLFLLPGDPFLDDLRGDPRFEALVQKITRGEISEDRQFLLRAEAAQRLQSCGRVRRRRLGALSGNRAGLSRLRCSELGHSIDRSAHHHGSAGCIDSGLGVRDHAGRNQA